LTSEINSKNYWNSRFQNDWSGFDGPSQSTFFANLAIKYMPLELVHEIKGQRLSIADWGCAEGDGTYELSKVFPDNNIVGIDFAPTGIKLAKTKFPGVKFIATNWLETLHKYKFQKFDIVFSSNTFEHFYDPFVELKSVILKCHRYLILLVPYEEDPLHSEHFYRFDDATIPKNLNGDLNLHSKTVIDCGQIENTYWPFKQVLLVYKRS
jgi:SAM-dependent methyltransferase